MRRLLTFTIAAALCSSSCGRDKAAPQGGGASSAPYSEAECASVDSPEKDGSGSEAVETTRPSDSGKNKPAVQPQQRKEIFPHEHMLACTKSSECSWAKAGEPCAEWQYAPINERFLTAYNQNWDSKARCAMSKPKVPWHDLGPWCNEGRCSLTNLNDYTCAPEESLVAGVEADAGQLMDQSPQAIYGKAYDNCHALAKPGTLSAATRHRIFRPEVGGVYEMEARCSVPNLAVFVNQSTCLTGYRVCSPCVGGKTCKTTVSLEPDRSYVVGVVGCEGDAHVVMRKLETRGLF